MNITHRTYNTVEILELTGRFDAYEVPNVTQWFENHPGVNHVAINLQGVDFIDSSGLSCLVKFLKRCRKNGGDMCIYNIQRPVMIIFELTRLDKAFNIFDDEISALNAIFA